MIEVDSVGAAQLTQLITNIDCGDFNEWEQDFIKRLKGRKYQDLSTREKAVVTRLIGWMNGSER